MIFAGGGATWRDCTLLIALVAGASDWMLMSGGGTKGGGGLARSGGGGGGVFSCSGGFCWTTSRFQLVGQLVDHPCRQAGRQRIDDDDVERRDQPDADEAARARDGGLKRPEIVFWLLHGLSEPKIAGPGANAPGLVLMDQAHASPSLAPGARRLLLVFFLCIVIIVFDSV